MSRTWGKYIIAIALVLVAFFPLLSFAQTDPYKQQRQLIEQISETANEAYDIEKDKSYSQEGFLSKTVTNTLQYAIGALGVVAVLLIIYAGILWMTAGGNDDQVSKAKTIIKQVVLGMLVIVLAYAIIAFVLTIVLSPAKQT